MLLGLAQLLRHQRQHQPDVLLVEREDIRSLDLQPDLTIGVLAAPGSW